MLLFVRSMQCVCYVASLCVALCVVLQETLAAVSQHVEDWKSLLSAAGLDDKQASQFLHSSASKSLTTCICSVLLLVLQYVIVCNFYPLAIFCCIHFSCYYRHSVLALCRCSQLMAITYLRFFRGFLSFGSRKQDAISERRFERKARLGAA